MPRRHLGRFCEVPDFVTTHRLFSLRDGCQNAWAHFPTPSQRSELMTRIAFLASLILAIAPLSAEDWPQFRGPQLLGSLRDQALRSVQFSDTEHVKWSVKLGDGIGCPVVAAGRVFTSAMIDDQDGRPVRLRRSVRRSNSGCGPGRVGDVDEIHHDEQSCRDDTCRRLPNASISTSPLSAWSGSTQRPVRMSGDKELPVPVLRLQVGRRDVARAVQGSGPLLSGRRSAPRNLCVRQTHR